jgi:hypothetical protein
MASAPPDPPAASPSRHIHAAFAALTLAALCFGIWRAVDLAWICDDAFISLRYAENLVLGNGLVYNPGERVEGYTNLLWTLLLAVALASGAPDVASAMGLGIASYVAVAGLLIHASLRRTRRGGAPFLPLAALVVLVLPDFHVWASGGLETSLFAALALAGLLLSRRAARDGRGALAAGVVLSLLTLPRPDGLLLAGTAAAGLLWDGRRRSAALLLAPVALTVVGWSAWKLAYYGELLPTAFYSKSVLRPYYAQGVVYLGLFLAKNWFLTPAAIGIATWRIATASPRSRDATVLGGSALLYLLYVVHVGGDFMFARRIVPVLPLLLLALEEVLVGLHPERARRIAALACVAAAALPYPIYGDGSARIRGVADERRFYTEGVLAMRRQQADVVGRALADAPVRVVFEGGMCVFGYYSGLPYLAEMSGLTQYSLAKLPLERRGWIGHEKRASDAWLAENDIHLIVSQHYPPVPAPADPPPVDLVYFGDTAVARITRYDPAVMEVLGRDPTVSFVPIERTLERKRREIERVSAERAEKILAWLEGFYLHGAGDRARGVAEELRALVKAKRRSGS